MDSRGFYEYQETGRGRGCVRRLPVCRRGLRRDVATQHGLVPSKVSAFSLGQPPTKRIQSSGYPTIYKKIAFLLDECNS